MDKLFIDAGHLHFHHKLWLNELVLFTNEFGIYQKRLTEIINSRNADKGYLRSLEEEYVEKKNEIEDLKGRIIKMDHDLSSYQKNNLLGYGDDFYLHHVELSSRVRVMREQYQYHKNQLSNIMENYAYVDYELEGINDVIKVSM
ncbi:hypothetical protein R9C00_15530 [Flammeovirgaceae bacterium SG7u.111]|nr:hypothetical protein [Flammeovirgaceae bacterium SG7u.132]WPO33114.1 hypothetical protein R9C00_15530 [Flammeovirgaceae bacterium SG7u.111]